MANKTLFSSNTKKSAQAGDLTTNSAGGTAYQMADRSALAQFALTGCFNNTYYTQAENQLDTVLTLLQKVSKEKDGLNFIAKLAIFSREKGHMKDMPAFLMSFLAFNAPQLYEQCFATVFNNAKMVRNHIQMVRSGKFMGKKSFPGPMRRQLKNWFKTRKADRLFRDNVGTPSLNDIIKMVHPVPETKEQEALYSYLIGKKPEEIKGTKFGATKEDLPELVKAYEDFKKDTSREVPEVPFEMLSSLNINDNVWTQIAKNAPWQMTRMNLNTFKRHNVLNDKKMVEILAERLSDEKKIKEAKAFPYQLMSAYMNAKDMPNEILSALKQAMEISVENIPSFDGEVYVFVDVSGSMTSSITGFRAGATSSIRCLDVASLIACSIARRNPNTKVIPFDTSLHTTAKVDVEKSIIENAQYLTRFGGGGTNCSLGLEMLVNKNAKVDLVIYVSDNESWADRYGGYGTRSSKNWETILQNNPNAKLVNIDLTPNTTVQVKDREGVLNIAGFSDQVFDVIKQFIKYGNDASHMVQYIEDDIVV